MASNETSSLVRRLAVFYAALFALPGIHMPFFPVWLEARNVDTGTIGVVLDLGMRQLEKLKSVRWGYQGTGRIEPVRRAAVRSA